MLDHEVGRNLKLLRFTVPERWTYIAGIVALAAKSPDRGAMLIAENIPVTARDVAEQASTSVRVANETLRKARALGMLYMEDGVERVHDFEELNPAPKRDETNAERQARHRAKRRRNAKSNGVTPVTVTARNAGEVEVEVEEEVEVLQETAKAVSVEQGLDVSKATRAQAGAVQRIFDHWRTTTNRHGAQLLPERVTILKARLKHFSEEDLMRAVDGSQTDDAVDVKTGHRYDDFKNIFRNGDNVETNIGRAEKANATGDTRSFIQRLNAGGKAA